MLTGKIIVITGGSGLLGIEFVKDVIKHNGVAIIADINKKSALNAKEAISGQFCDALVDFVELDITCSESIEKMISYLDGKYGKIDALVNNAYPRNKEYGKHFFDVNYKDFVENVGMNLGGYFLTSQLFSKYFKKQGYGNIVNISSIYGVIAPKFKIYDNTEMTVPVEYAAIKSGLIHLTKYMAKYLKGTGIRVNTLSPGGILDDQPKYFLDQYNNECMGKGMLNKADLNGTLLYLLSDMSQYVNGQNIVIDDGFSL
jgi:NAD(P)-dependent dehydrogenase (short-subunit alcohol dehydrogenase family)